MAKYNKLDLSKINFSNERVTFAEAVKDKPHVVFKPTDFSKDGTLKVRSAKGDASNICVKLEI